MGLGTFEKAQRVAELTLANNEVRPIWNDFQQKLHEFDDALADADAKFGTYIKQREPFDEAFLDLQYGFSTSCAPFVKEQGRGIPLDCELKRKKVLDAWLERRRSPQCLLGETSVFPQEKTDEDVKVAAPRQQAIPLAAIGAFEVLRRLPGDSPAKLA